MEALVTDENDWLFNAATYLKYSPQEDWSIRPPEMRSDRETLIRIANAYFDVFKDSSRTNDVPWNIPCARLEGGIYSNPENKPDASCTGGPPLEGTVDITNRRFLVDVDMDNAALLELAEQANICNASKLPSRPAIRLL